MPAITPWVTPDGPDGPDGDVELDELERLGFAVEFVVVEFVVLEGLFDTGSKISFTATDVHEGGYLLPLEAVRKLQ